MFKKTIGLMAALCLSACEPMIPEVDFQDGLPTADTAKLELPKGASGQGVLRTQEQALRGDGSGLFGITWATTVLVNGGTLYVVAGLGAVASQPPASVVGDTATFGPHTPVNSETTWRLSVTRKGPNLFDYVLEGKPKAGADTEYAKLLDGNHEVAISADNRPMRGFGEGRFTIYWDHVTRLSNEPRKRGTAEFRYTRTSPTDKVRVEVDLQELIGNETTPRTALYRFAQVPGGAGSFEFAVDTNVHWFDGTRAALERLSIKSRWVESGEGRADVRLSGGDLTAPGTLNECWDNRFRSTFLRRSDNLESWGVEAQDCVYTSAEYSQ